eukprot:m.28031 g.28031  ORF g.28031 m.28031 type:complete len:409 (-) comp7965_c0_seq3:57-1283(-)
MPVYDGGIPQQPPQSRMQSQIPTQFGSGPIRNPVRTMAGMPPAMGGNSPGRMSLGPGGPMGRMPGGNMLGMMGQQPIDNRMQGQNGQLGPVRQGVQGRMPVSSTSGTNGPPGGSYIGGNDSSKQPNSMSLGDDFPILGAENFPSLGSRPGPANAQFPNLSLSSVASLQYNGKRPKSEFNMSADMFPALPTSKTGSKTSPGSSPRSPGSVMPAENAAGSRRPAPSREKHILGADDQFGLLGLLNIIRTPDHDLKTLALGTDLTTLGLNLNSPDVLFPSFQSPWADTPLRPKEPPFQLPTCYAVKANLPPVPHRMAQQQLADETLFYAFYGMPGDINQLAAAAALYERHWRYHKEQKVWITRAPGVEPTHRTNTYEQGTYIYFEISQWKKVTKEFRLQYDQLEERKPMPT